MLENFEIDVDKKFKRDLEYIKADLITKQLQKDIKDNKFEEEDEKEKYVKFSRMLGVVTIMNLTKKQYKKYWESQYKGYPEKNEIIMKAVEEKFKKGLTPREDMINMIKKSKDFESEKNRAIKLLSKKRK